MFIDPAKKTHFIW